MRFIDYIMFFLFGAVVGIFVYIFAWEKKVAHNPMPPEKQQILLEQIKKVSKLVTVQGDYLGVNDFHDYYGFNIGMLAKTMILKTTAKISVGYDLQKATFEADSIHRIIRVRNLPKAEIIAIEHDTETPYVKVGFLLNLTGYGFSGDEITTIHKEIKNELSKTTTVDSLLKVAEEEGIGTLDIIKVLVEQGGWTFEIIDDTAIIKENLDKINIPEPNINNITNSSNIKN